MQRLVDPAVRPATAAAAIALAILAVSLLIQGCIGANQRVEETIALDEIVQSGSADHAIHVHTLGELQIATDELASAEDALPRMPPMRVRGSVRFQTSGFQAGAELMGVAAQDRVFSVETPGQPNSL